MGVHGYHERYEDSEAAVPPGKELMTGMGNYNDELVKAGIVLAGEVLKPTLKGKRVRFSGSKRTVVDGPRPWNSSPDTRIWQPRSIEEAVEWLKRCPNPHCEDSEVEIRPVFEAEDFGENLTPEAREQEERRAGEGSQPGNSSLSFFFVVEFANCRST